MGEIKTEPGPGSDMEEEGVPLMNGHPPRLPFTTQEVPDVPEQGPEPLQEQQPPTATTAGAPKTTMTASTSTTAANEGDGGSGDEEHNSFMESYDWEKEKLKSNQFFDDGTMSYFW